MKKNNILVPIMRQIDKVIFGIEEINEIEKQPELVECENEEEFDVVRSIN